LEKENGAEVAKKERVRNAAIALPRQYEGDRGKDTGGPDNTSARGGKRLAQNKGSESFFRASGKSITQKYKTHKRL